MEHLEFSIILFFSSIVAGVLGALSGLGGGIIIVPLLVLYFKIDTLFAIGASLISVIATSLGASSTFLAKGYTNVRVGIFLSTATTIGAVIGAITATQISQSTIHLLFSVLLIYSTFSNYFTKEKAQPIDDKSTMLCKILKLDGTYPSASGLKSYKVRAPFLGWCLMFISGIFSGLLGIGSGALNVLALVQVMRFPFRISTTTSNYIIGTTACASAGTFLHLGYVSPSIAMPLIPGVVIGSMLGAKLVMTINIQKIKYLFSFLVLIIALQMLFHGIRGG